MIKGDGKLKASDLTITIYADGADIEAMKEEYRKGYVKGFTTNPTLMKKAGVTDYVTFAKECVKEIPDLPLSLEVFADDFEGMEEEARIICGLGKNVFVKIPITNSKGDTSYKETFHRRTQTQCHRDPYDGTDRADSRCVCRRDEQYSFDLCGKDNGYRSRCRTHDEKSKRDSFEETRNAHALGKLQGGL